MNILEYKCNQNFTWIDFIVRRQNLKIIINSRENGWNVIWFDIFFFSKYTKKSENIKDTTS